MAHTLSAAKLTPRSVIMVAGNVEFARLTKVLDGDALKADDDRRSRNGQIPVGKPYTTITVSNAAIIPTDPSGQLTYDEKYVEETFYTSTKKPGLHFSFNNKSRDIPRYYQVRIDENGNVDNTKVDEIPASGEFAEGLRIVIMLRVFKSKDFQNCGLALDGVIVQEKVRYYQGRGAVSALTAMGMTVTELPEAERTAAQKAAQSAPEMASSAEEAPAVQPPVEAPKGNPYATASQAVASMQAQQAANPNANPFAASMNPPQKTEPAPQAAPAAPTPATPTPAPAAQTAANTASDAWTCPGCGTQTSGKFCNNCGTPKPAGTAGTNPYATPELGSQVSGIRFDPNEVNKNY